jgi:hypothetical protein
MALADAYVNHGEALEWDLFHLWGVDINDPRMTIRRLRNFFFRLPVDSETVNDIAEVPREARAWNVDTWMLANVVDALAHLDWVTIAAHSKHAPRPPKPFPRPTIKKVVKSKKTIWPGRTIVDNSFRKNL